MSRRLDLEHRYVEFIPKELEDGILYISDRFSTASHMCCCGCGQKVVTPLNPAKWHITEHGSTVSLTPSIGLGALPCRSHYWIRRSRVEWCPSMTEGETRRARIADEYASQVNTGERSPVTAPAPAKVEESRRWGRTIWLRLKLWVRSLWK